MYKSDSVSCLLLKRKVAERIESIKEESFEVFKILDKIEGSVSQCVDNATAIHQKLDHYNENVYFDQYENVVEKVVKVDDDLTIVIATLTGCCEFIENVSGFEGKLEDVQSDRSNPSNFLVRKLLSKVTTSISEGKLVKLYIKKLKCDVETVVSEVNDLVSRSVCGFGSQENVFEVYREISRDMGPLEIDITMWRVRVTDWDDLIEEKTKQQAEAGDRFDSLSVVNGSKVGASGSGGYITNHKNEDLSLIGNYSSDEYLVEHSSEVLSNDENVTRDVNEQLTVKEEVEVENNHIDHFLISKIQEKPKLHTICNSNDKYGKLVKERLLDRLGKSENSQYFISGLNSSSSGIMTSSSQENNRTGQAGSSSSVVKFRRVQLENVKKTLGIHGEPFMEGEYKKFTIVFEEGSPNLFWVRAESVAMKQFQMILQKRMKGKPIGDGGGPGLQVGSVLFARYTVDKCVYRARVEEIISGDESLYCVRYIDYGNREDYLTYGDLYTWDSMYEIIPPQAVSCCFYQAPPQIKNRTCFTVEEKEAFTRVMKNSSMMQMVIHERHAPLHNMFRNSKSNAVPEVSLSLRCKDGKDVLTRLPLIPEFSAYFSHQRHDTIDPCLHVDEGLTILNLLSLEQPSTILLRAAPQPLHLEGEDLIDVCFDAPPSPVNPVTVSKSVEKVLLWNTDETFQQQQRVKDESNKEFKKMSKFQEPDIFTFPAEINERASTISHARNPNPAICQPTMDISRKPKRGLRPRPFSKCEEMKSMVCEKSYRSLDIREAYSTQHSRVSHNIS